ncbi:MAG: protein kinase [Desulfobacterales bacterium]|nr:protein kinase [Desulfobacterales bacterium]MDX2511261.1 protein kinase [Desulfobacterales bacterium]
MSGGVDYWLGQLLSLVFYLMTIIVYNRAKKEYVGGKIAAAINLIMVCLVILFFTDFIDYFLLKLVPLGKDTIIILKILLKLTAICVLFFGGLRFFASRSTPSVMDRDTDILVGIHSELPQTPVTTAPGGNKATVVIEDLSEKKKPLLGRYEILEQIGKGAMGIVYKGRDPKLNRLTAIKTIRFIDEYDEDKAEQIKKQFYREAEVVAKLSHKNIVKMYDVGEDLDLSYLAMEYLEGESLEQYTTADNLLPLHQCFDYIIQMCEALHYAHTHGVVHRDIKPGNIMILTGGLAKVMDFGIARAAGGTKTRTGIIKGTPFYMSPEQAKGAGITGASDIFSLGVLFYQLLTGKLPFTGENLATIMYQTTNVAPEPVTTYQPDLDPAVVSILDKALEKNAEMRFSSAKEMADALRTSVGKLQTDDHVQEVDVAGPVFPDTGDRVSGSETGLEESIDLSDLEQVLKAEVVTQEEKGVTGIDTGKPPGERSPGDTVPDNDKNEKRKGFDLSELREIIAAGRQGGTESESPHQTDSGVGMDAFKRVDAVKTDTHLQSAPTNAFQEDLDAVIQPKPAPNEFKGERRALPGYVFPVAYAILALILITGGYYFFWKSPNADNRLLKLVYYKYFESGEQKNKKMEEEQRRRVQEILQQKMTEKQRLAQIQADKKVEQEKKTAIEEEKKNIQMALVTKKMEEQKKLEAERQAIQEQEQNLEKERLLRIEAEKKKEAERIARIAEEKKRVLEQQARIEKETQEAALQKNLSRVNTLVGTADTHRQNKEYNNAKKQYTAALDLIEQSAYRKDSRLLQQKVIIQDKLLQDDMVYGPKGYIHYQGAWVSPGEYEALRLKEGYVKFQGKFRDYRTLRKLIRSKTEPRVESYVLSKYSNETFHKKDIKYQRVTLKNNTSRQSSYVVDYTWEVWRFKGVDEGACSIEIVYDVAKDSWKLVQGCE